MKALEQYLLDCLQYLNDIQDFTERLDEEAFTADRKTQLAVIRNSMDRRYNFARGRA